MGELYGIWESFWKNIGEFENKISAVAKRSGLSEKAALLLIAVNNYQSIFAEENLKQELLSVGLCEYNERGLKITSKGAIVAKACEQALKKA